ncbi:MAG: hypothetical protein L0332_05795 [Chloroflexi bacterium]|nr:hypothetical protein [Chloroflexota bacterium]MCI0643599.1 hypothetical protein [Chloroflexota bacterium]MCI0726221.1 hypothetical protein [Chloroflexota bacterium]
MPIQQLKKVVIFLSFIFFFCLGGARAAAAQEEESFTLAATAGFDGLYKGEFWLPVHVHVANSGPNVDGKIKVSVGTATGSDFVVYTSPVSLPTQSEKRLTLYVFVPNFASSLTVELLDERERVVETVRTNALTRLAMDDLLYGVVTPEPGEFGLLEDIYADRGDAGVAFLDVSQLPAAAAAWNALDVIIFHDVDTAQLAAEQLSALKGWLGTGGQLVVAGGPAWQRTTAGLADLLPVTVSGVQSLADLPVLVSQTGVAFRDPGPYLVAQSSLRSGELLIHQDGLPLLARQSIGRGAVYFLALDPNLAPMADWDGSEFIWQTIARVTPRLPVWAVGAQNSYAAGSAIASLPSLALPSTLQLFFFLFVYVLVVGPVNYFVLNRLKRRELSWLTIPALVVLFTGCAYLAGFQLKGNDVIINQMSIAFGQAGQDQVRVQSLVGLYSPRRASYDMVFPAESLVRPFDRNYGTLTGSGNLEAIDRGHEVTVEEVRVDVSDVQTFVADVYRPAPAVTGQTTLRLEGTTFELEVTVQNNSNVTLENAVVLLGSTAIVLDDLEPGESETKTQHLAAAEGSAVAGSSAGGMPVYTPPGVATSPLAANYDKLLGTSNYYDDREVFPRWQLLQAIAPEYGTTGWFPQGMATLIAWTDEQLLDVGLDRGQYDSEATTLYFIELPLDRAIVSGQDVALPRAFLSWQVLDQQGVYNPTIEELYLPAGWIELEFQPWPEFQTMRVEELTLYVVRSTTPGSSQPLPRVRLWHWEEEDWVTVDGARWGSMSISSPGDYVGPGNAVRIRLENDSEIGIQIKQIYPRLEGDLE